jgi:iron complex outermembrane receptor protein
MRAAALAVLVAATPAAASETTPQRIVVEGSAAQARQAGSAAMTVVGREALDAHGDLSVTDVLQRLPGITLDGETPRLRGLGEGYTLVLINGEPAPPGFSLETLAPAEIERIEIVRGPSAEHGGVAGTINIVLRTPPRTRQREARAALGYRALQPQGNATLSWGDRHGEGAGQLGWQLPLSVYAWANAADSVSLRATRTPAGEATLQRFEQRTESRGHGLNLGPRLQWRPTAQQQLQAQLFLQANESDNRSARDTASLAGPPADEAADRARTRGSWRLARAQLQWEHRGDDGARLELKASAQTTRALAGGSGLQSLAAGGGAPATPGAATLRARDTLSSDREHRHAAGARWRQPWGESHALTLGLDADERQRRELRRRFESGAEVLGGTLGQPYEVQLRRSVLFMQDDWDPTPRSSASAGLRLERLEVRTGAAGPAAAPVRQRSQSLSPLLQWRGTWGRAPAGQGAADAAAGTAAGAGGGSSSAAAPVTWRLGLARSVRLPEPGLLLPRYTFNGLYERQQTNTPLAADSAGNPALRPERASVLDAALEWPLGGGAQASAGVFHRRIDGLIRRRLALETVPEAPVPRWVSRPANLGGARSSGLELELKGPAAALLPAAWAPSRTTLRAAVSVYRSAVEQIDDPDARLDGQAPWAASFGLDRAPGGPARPGTAGLAPSGWGASLVLAPSFATQQTDRQRVWRRGNARLDAYAVWRPDRDLTLRLAGSNLLAPQGLTRSTVDDLDGFVATAETRSRGRRQLTASVVLKF